MSYEHINDCWRALRECETLEEVKEKFDEFPRWSGDWDTYDGDGKVVVVNTYYEYDDEQEDEEELDIDWPSDDEDEED